MTTGLGGVVPFMGHVNAFNPGNALRHGAFWGLALHRMFRTARLFQRAYYIQMTHYNCCCLLLFLTFSVLVANPKKLLYTVANPARGLLNREKRTKEKDWQHTPPPPPPTLLVRRK